MSYEDDDDPTVVIDNGSSSIKFGMAGDDIPKSWMPSVVGRTRPHQGSTGKIDTYVGEEAQRRRSILSLKYPIEYGMVTDWDDMEKIWHYLLHDDLRVTTEENHVMLTEPVRNPKYNRQKMAEIMFESFQVPSLYVAIQAHLSFYAAGRTSGLVLESGEGTTHTLVVYEGYSVASAIHRSHLAGMECTNYLMRLLNQREYSFSTSAEREIVREMKEKLCYVALDYEREQLLRKSDTIDYQLPDGQTVSLGQEVFQCTEALFRPSILDADAPSGLKSQMGLSDMIHSAMINCDSRTWGTLYRNIILTGGNTMYRGFEDRVKSDLLEKAPRRTSIYVIARPERKYCAWIGGSILGSLMTYKSKVRIPKSAYEEYGPSVVHRDLYTKYDPERPMS